MARRCRFFATKPDAAFSPLAGQQLGILRRMGAPVSPAYAFEQVAQPDLVIDGLIGYSLRGEPRGAAAKLINWANTTGAPILALDTPSGVDATTGGGCWAR
jgi:NAD(P)H-hydrate epimerase